MSWTLVLRNGVLSHWSCFAERLACRLALFWYRVGGPPCRWLCALPKGLYRPKLQQMLVDELADFSADFGPQMPGKYVLFRQGVTLEGKGGL
jgi:hypothetical protein